MLNDIRASYVFARKLGRVAIALGGAIVGAGVVSMFFGAREPGYVVFTGMGFSGLGSLLFLLARSRLRNVELASSGCISVEELSKRTGIPLRKLKP